MAAGVKHEHDFSPGHVDRCPSCWAALAQRHAAEVGSPPPGADRMAQLFGCEAVRRDLHLLAGVTLERLPATFPAMAHHLQWCAACRDDAAELLAVAADAAGSASPAPTAVWRPAPPYRDAEVFELATDVVAMIEHGMAAFLAVPTPATIVATVAPDGARRGTQTGAVGLGRQLRVPLRDSGLFAQLAVDGLGEHTMRLEVSLSGMARGPMSAKVFVSDDGDLALLGAEPLALTRAATFRGIPPGRYVVEIHEQAHRKRFRLNLVVQPRS